MISKNEDLVNDPDKIKEQMRISQELDKDDDSTMTINE